MAHPHEAKRSPCGPFAPHFNFLLLVDKNFKITSITSEITLLEIITTAKLQVIITCIGTAETIITISFTVQTHKIWGFLSAIKMIPFLAYTAANPFFSRFAVGPGLQAVYAGPLFITEVTVTGWLAVVFS